MKSVGAPSIDKVLEAIFVSLEQNGASLHNTARLLQMSPRSLQRRLAEMATTYRSLVTQARMTEACRSLATTEERIQDISDRLGFAGPSSFSRAFARFEKTPPRIFRRNHLSHQKKKTVRIKQ